MADEFEPGRPVIENLNRSVKRGMVWIAFERGGLQVLNVVTSAVLARLLTPAMFGIMGASAFFTGMSRRLVHLGFGAALIRRPEIRPDHVSTLFVITLLINLALCGLMLAVSPLAGRYFGNPLVGEVLRWMSLLFVLRSIGAVPAALLRRRMDYESNAYATFLDAIFKIVVAVPLAWLGFGVWSLVYGELAGSLADKLYLAYRARWVPSLVVTRAAFNDLFAYGMNMSLRSVLGYASDNADNIIVGRSLGLTALGLYEKSFHLMRLPVAELSGRLRIVLFPALARLQHEPGRMRAAFRKSVLGMSLVGYPLFATLVALGGPIILVLYGEQWAASVVPFQLLCLSGPLRMIAQLSTSAIDACGQLGKDLRRRAFSLAVMIPLVFLGLRWGLTGVAAAVLGSTLLSFTLMATVLRSVTPVKVSDLMRPQLLPFLASLMLTVTQVALLWLGLARGWPQVVILLAAAPAGLLVYAAVLFLFRTDPLEALWRELHTDARGPLRRVPLLRRWA